jgi:hypothetical protein
MCSALRPSVFLKGTEKISHVLKYMYSFGLRIAALEAGDTREVWNRKAQSRKEGTR